MAKYEPITLLHISDTQFGDKHAFKPGALLESLKRDLDILKNDFALVPSVVVLTGDLTESGREPEFEQALEFVEELAKHLVIDKKHFAIVPGNHDIHRESCHEYFDNCMKKHQAFQEPYWPKLYNYAKFFKRFYGSSFSFSEKQPWTLFKISGRKFKLVIAGLNSTMKDSHKSEDHYGYVGKKQLDQFAEKLAKYKEREWLRIVALHHNVRSAAPGDNAGLKDAKEFTRLLGGSANLILHGHIHEDVTELTNMGVPILATGSAAIKRDKRPEEIPNQYQIIQIWPTGFKRWCRAYYVGQARWIGDTRIHKDGYEWAQEMSAASFHNLSGTFGIPADSFADVENFLEIGDTITAADLVLNEKPISKCSDIDLHRYLLIKQKFGLPIRKNEDVILDTKVKEEKASKQTTRPNFYLLKIKLLSQQGRFSDVLDQISKIREIASNELKPALKRRKQIANTITTGYRPPSKQNNGNSHSKVTSDTLDAIAQYFCTASPGAEVFHKSVQMLRSAQVDYLRQSTDGKYWQTCRIKSAIQALFSEAAILMVHSGHECHGWTRLVAAHLLASRIMITPLAEGYSELLSMIWCEEHHVAKRDDSRKSLRALFELAMRSGYSQQREFRKKMEAYGSRRSLYVQLAKVFDKVPTSNPAPRDWHNLRAYLDEVDGYYC